MSLKYKQASHYDIEGLYIFNVLTIPDQYDSLFHMDNITYQKYAPTLTNESSEELMRYFIIDDDFFMWLNNDTDKFKLVIELPTAKHMEVTRKGFMTVKRYFTFNFVLTLYDPKSAMGFKLSWL